MIYCLTGTFADCSLVFDFPLRNVERIQLLALATDGYADEPVVVLRFNEFVCNQWKQTLGFTDNDAIVPMGAFFAHFSDPIPLFFGKIGILPKISVNFFNTSRVSLSSIGSTKVAIWLEISQA